MNYRATIQLLTAQEVRQPPHIVALLFAIAIICSQDAYATPVTITHPERCCGSMHARSERIERPAMGLRADASKKTNAASTESEEQKEAVAQLRNILSTEEIPNLQIGWHINDAFGGYSLALEQNKPTVIIFHSPYCGFCYNMLAKMACPQVSRFAGRIVFSVSIEEMDLGAKQLFVALDVVRLPTLIMLEPNKNRIHVMARIEGEVSPEDIDRIFLEGTKNFDGFDKDLLLSAADVEALSISRGISVPEHCQKGAKAQ